MAIVAEGGWPLSMADLLRAIGQIALFWALGIVFLGLPSLLVTIPLSVAWLATIRFGKGGGGADPPDGAKTVQASTVDP